MLVMVRVVGVMVKIEVEIEIAALIILSQRSYFGNTVDDFCDAIAIVLM